MDSSTLNFNTLNQNAPDSGPSISLTRRPFARLDQIENVYLQLAHHVVSGLNRKGSLSM
jgi:hypothetical protein